jgi:methylenetetrahydrofolate dehydrogenase (NADP+)/methenyltetrahydrofolate cyclohydrolase
MLLEGKKVAKAIEDELALRIQNLKQDNKRCPKLVVLLVGDNPASKTYVASKEKACLRVGIESQVIRLNVDSSYEEVLKNLHQLNEDNTVDGILIQLPLPKHLDAQSIIEHLDPAKDVDGLHPENVAKLYTQNKGFIPCTPKGIMSLLKYYEVPISGQNAVVIGRSSLVGRPIAQLLIYENATVTVCHSKTQDISLYTKQADLIVVAIGQAHFLKANHIEKKAYIIDVGINRVDQKLVGDCDTEALQDLCLGISPVPGGVGPLTIASLLENTLEAYLLKE